MGEGDEAMRDRQGLLSKDYYADSSHLWWEELFSFSWLGIGGHFCKWKFVACFWAERGWAENSPRVCCFFQLPSAQNAPYAKVVYSGVAYSDPLQS